MGLCGSEFTDEVREIDDRLMVGAKNDVVDRDGRSGVVSAGSDMCERIRESGFETEGGKKCAAPGTKMDPESVT
jgi:hypothetical protein